MSEEKSNPDVHEIEVGGQKFLVTGAMKAAFEQEREEQKKKAEPPKQTERFLPPASIPPDPGYDRDQGGNFFDDPDAVIDKKIRQARDEWRQEITQEREIDKWWETFFGKYKALRGKKVLIQTIMHQNLDKLEKIQSEQSSDAAMEELAKIVRKELILDVKESDETGPSPVVEGGPAVMTGHPADTGQSSPKPQQPVTLGSILKKRFDRRHESAAKAAG